LQYAKTEPKELQLSSSVLHTAKTGGGESLGTRLIDDHMRISQVAREESGVSGDGEGHSRLKPWTTDICDA